MSEVLHANIFFFIASFATVVFCIIGTLILFQVYKIIKIIRSLLERVESASEAAAEDIAHVRQLVARGGLLSTVFGLAFDVKKKRRSPKKSADEDN